MIMAIASTDILKLDVRVNPGNGDLAPDDPEYIRRQIEKADKVKATIVERMREEAEKGALDMETDLGNPLVSTQEAAILFGAQRMTQRIMTLQAALSGYGMAGKVDSLGFHGVADIHWVLDDTVPVGEFQFEEVEDPVTTFQQLMSAIP
jgi:hypothetical protein